MTATAETYRAKAELRNEPAPAAALKSRHSDGCPRADVDWDNGVLLIRESKFGKTRHIPLRASSVAALRRSAGTGLTFVERNRTGFQRSSIARFHGGPTEADQRENEDHDQACPEQSCNVAGAQK